MKQSLIFVNVITKVFKLYLLIINFFYNLVWYNHIVAVAKLTKQIWN